MVISDSKRDSIGIFGGTFDPVHRAHVQMACELKQNLGLDEMRLVPCHLPPHRQSPGASSLQRAEMVQIALGEPGASGLSLDTRELNRNKASYTVDTLHEIRAEVGEDVSLCLCMGMDSLAGLESWYQWQELLSLSHIAVVGRPGFELPKNGPLAQWVKNHLGCKQALEERPYGTLVIENTGTLLPISATSVRASLAQGENISDQISEGVWRYINEQGLYGVKSSGKPKQT